MRRGVHRLQYIKAMAVIIATLLAIAWAYSADPASSQSDLIDRFTQACTGDNPYFVTSCFALGERQDEPADRCLPR